MIKVVTNRLKKEDDFDETEHPRDESGRFAPKGEGAVATKEPEKKPLEERKMPKRMHLGGGRITSATKPEPEPEPKKPEPEPVAPPVSTGGRPLTVTRKPMRRVEPPKKPPKARDLPGSHWINLTTGLHPDWDTANAILSIRGKGVKWKQVGDFDWEATSSDLPGKFVISRLSATYTGSPYFMANYMVDGKPVGISGMNNTSKEGALSDFANKIQDGIDRGLIKKPVVKPEDPHTGWYKEPPRYFETAGSPATYETAKHIVDGYDTDKDKMFAKKDEPGSRDREDETIFIVPGASRTHRAHFKVWHYVDEDGKTSYYARYFENGDPIGDATKGDTAADAVEKHVSKMRNEILSGRLKPPARVMPKPSWITAYKTPFSDRTRDAATRLLEGYENGLVWETDYDARDSFKVDLAHEDMDFSKDCFIRASKFIDDDGTTKYAVGFFDDSHGLMGDVVIANSPDEGAETLVDRVKADIDAGKYTRVDRKARMVEKKAITEEISKKKEPLFKLTGRGLATVTSYIDSVIERMYGGDTEEGKKKIIDKIESNMKKLVEGKAIYKRLDRNDLTGVLRDPEMRFKTLFETGTGHGCTSTSTRAGGEHRGMGIPVDVDPRLRPVYGYIDKGTFGSEADGYGEIAVKFKPHVRDRTTFTLGDSLGPMCSSELAPAPVNKPDYRAADHQVERIARGAEVSGYIETQIHGGVTMDEVEEVIFTGRCFKGRGVLAPAYAKIEKQLLKMGMKVTYNESTY